MPRFHANSPSRSSVCESAPADQRAQLGAHRKQAGGLAIHQFHAIGFGHFDAADALKLQQLAFHHHLGQPDQQIQHVEVALAQRHLKGFHVEPIACQHRRMIAPAHIGGRASAARARVVDHIVMHQRSGVHDLHHRAQMDRAPVGRRAANQFRSQQQQQRAQPLAAALLQVLADLSDHVHRRDGLHADLLLHELQIVVDEIEDLHAADGLP